MRRTGLALGCWLAAGSLTACFADPVVSDSATSSEGSSDDAEDTDADTSSGDSDDADGTSETTTETAEATEDTTETGSVDSDVVVNELVAGGSGNDWVEFYNRAEAAVDISGWRVRDGAGTVPQTPDLGHLYLFPDGTIIEPGGFVFVERTDNPATGLTFGLSGDGDAVFLFDPNEVLMDSTEWTLGDAPDNFAWGRLPDGDGAFQTLATPTQGFPNAG